MNSILRITHPLLLAILLTATAIDAKFTISTGKLAPVQITAGSDPREVLTKAWAAMETAKSYRYRIEYPPDLPDRTTVIEYVSPDRYHTTQKNQETIVIGNDFYEKRGDKPWRQIGQIDNGTAGVVLKFPKQKRYDSMKTARDIKLIGADKIDGVESLIYEYDNYDSSGNTLLVKVKVWVAAADGLLRRVEGQVQVEPHKATMIYTYYDYNADIKIESPEFLAELPVPETVQVDPQLQPKRDGMGSGDRTGLGPGRGYNMGGGDPSLGGNPNPDGSAKTVDAKPILLNRPQPLYTEEARKNKIQGTVRVRILVGADGRVKRASIVTGLPDGLNEMALQTAHKMQFKPAMKDGKPVAYWFNNVSFEFKL